MNILNNVACIIRTYNNNPETTKSVTRALNNGVGLVIVVVNAHDESTRGSVRTWLAGAKKANEKRLVIIEMNQGYTWSNALNVAFAHVRQFNRLANLKGIDPIDHVLCVSNEVLWERDHLKALLRAVHQSERIGVVGTTFEGRQDGNVIDLGRSYIHPRNTFMLIRWTAFQAVGHFDAVCDGYGGMEDLHFIMSMVLSGNWVWRRVELGIKLLLGKNYDQAHKEGREADAMRQIASYFRAAVDDVPELKERVESTLREFQIADL